MTIDEMIDRTIGHEGKYSNHPNDTGGETMWGITHWTARANGYAGSMAQMPRSEAVRIYRQQYADRPGFSEVAKLSPAVGAELFDTGVNMGPDIPARWFQELLNTFNNEGRYYPDIIEDADIGPATMRAFKAYLVRRPHDGEEVMLKALNCLQGARYVSLAQRRQKNEAFVFGWFRRVAL